MLVLAAAGVVCDKATSMMHNEISPYNEER